MAIKQPRYDQGCLSGRVYFVLALVLMHRVQALTLWPPKIEYCKFGKSLTMEGLMEWDLLMVRL